MLNNHGFFMFEQGSPWELFVGALLTEAGPEATASARHAHRPFDMHLEPRWPLTWRDTRYLDTKEPRTMVVMFASEERRGSHTCFQGAPST